MHTSTFDSHIFGILRCFRETGTFVVKGTDEIVQQLDDHIVMTQSMSFSPFKKAFAERIDKWEAKLNLVSEIIEQWLICQRSVCTCLITNCANDCVVVVP